MGERMRIGRLHIQACTARELVEVGNKWRRDIRLFEAVFIYWLCGYRAIGNKFISI